MKPFTYASVSHVILNHMRLLKIILYFQRIRWNFLELYLQLTYYVRAVFLILAIFSIAFAIRLFSALIKFNSLFSSIWCSLDFGETSAGLTLTRRDFEQGSTYRLVRVGAIFFVFYWCWSGAIFFNFFWCWYGAHHTEPPGSGVWIPDFDFLSLQPRRHHL